MVRLMLTLTPVVCVCGGIVVSEVLNTYLDMRRPVWLGGEDTAKPETSSKQQGKNGTEDESDGPIGITLFLYC
jgi:dolichyl-diphosphooligosaccharide---protein glycosyltransferase